MDDFDLHEEMAASEDAAEQAIKDAEENGYKAGLLEAAGVIELERNRGIKTGCEPCATVFKRVLDRLRAKASE